VFASRHWGRRVGAVAVLAMAMVACGPASRAEVPADTEAAAFFEALWPAAQARGVTRDTFERAAASFGPDPDVLQLALNQPEQVKTPGSYLSELISETRIATGRQKAIEHAALLAALESAYGVDRRVLLAVWGVESAYGTAKGSRSVIRSLATLAMSDARRAGFWRKELLAALRMLQDGAAPEALVGSWAGAMGHTQFIPSAYAAHAVDFDRDGRRDIWGSVADALASTANYLQASGWAPGVPWGWEVVLPAGFDFAWSAPGRTRTWPEWQSAGVTAVAAVAAGDAVRPDRSLQLILPAGARGPAFLVTGNFRALRRYNQSSSYALAVGHLADRIGGGAALAAAWPADDKALTRAEREELQSLLAERGRDTGGLDGIMGDRTRAAIRATQRTLNLAEDGHPSAALLHQLRGVVAP
jgi:membrane-bound lytic murein transglycosylase B